MENLKKIRQVEQSVAGKNFTVAGVCIEGSNPVKKIFVAKHLSDTWVKNDLPETEVVENVNSILSDSDIDLVIMPEAEKNNVEIVSTVLNTGKNLRIV